MARRATGQKHDRGSDILGAAEPTIWIRRGERFLTAVFSDQPRRHFRGDEPWRDAVTEDVSGAELDGEVTG